MRDRYGACLDYVVNEILLHSHLDIALIAVIVTNGCYRTLILTKVVTVCGAICVENPQHD